MKKLALGVYSRLSASSSATRMQSGDVYKRQILLHGGNGGVLLGLVLFLPDAGKLDFQLMVAPVDEVDALFLSLIHIFRGIVDDQIHAGSGLQCADVAALAADDAALHFIAGQRHDTDGGLAAMVGSAAAEDVYKRQVYNTFQ